MTLDDVHRASLDMFAEIDSQALRTVAIKDNKDFSARFVPFFSEIFGESSEEAFQREMIGIQTEDGPSLSAVNPTEVQDGSTANRGIEQFFHDHDHWLKEAYSVYRQEGHNATDLKLSEKTHKDGINLIGDVYSNGEPVGYVGNNLLDGTSSTSHDVTASPSESNPQLVEVPIMLESVLEKLESLSTDTVSNKESMNNLVGIGDDSTSNATMSQSSQTQIHVLDEIIANARNNKKILFSKLESVISLMRQVELKEQAAKLAKREAEIVGLNTVNKVDELERILKHAIVANQTHDGDVYSEKAILVTELRELHACLFSVSDERDKSLGVLDEIHYTLELRLTAAEDEIKAAAQEKLDIEMAGRILLAHQESIIKKVMQESKILKQQTEDNLKEFLVDRGRVVDMLQGEISVICQDVKLLKEKLDETGSFSKSLSSSQISFMKASSDSLLKNLIPDQTEAVPVRDDSLVTRNQTDNEKISEDDRRAFLNDGWDFLDNHEIEA